MRPVGLLSRNLMWIAATTGIGTVPWSTEPPEVRAAMSNDPAVLIEL
ncbi:hypothetical protein A4U53_033155 [Rhizobium ruizarguesonis]|uniref:Uncharacterized protein n=1 Tax=Rhizobium ruizarguesonis TaxID=2081791 RepID=A0ACD5ENT9_9HYPH|nr:hypothetical protein [Rhizobium leguminosarum]